jgi:hypothetical protein
MVQSIYIYLLLSSHWQHATDISSKLSLTLHLQNQHPSIFCISLCGSAFHLPFSSLTVYVHIVYFSLYLCHCTICSSVGIKLEKMMAEWTLLLLCGVVWLTYGLHACLMALQRLRCVLTERNVGVDGRMLHWD